MRDPDPDTMAGTDAAPHRRDGLRTPFAERPPRMVYVIIALCIAVEILSSAGDAGLLSAPRLRRTVIEYAGFWPGLLNGWSENYAGQRFAMFFSYGFLHGGVLHLAMNMYTLWVLSQPIAERVGTTGFASIYMGSMVGGAVGYAMLAPAPIPMVGASGALFGLAGAITAWVAQDARDTGTIGTLARISAYLIGINVVMWWVLDGQLAWQTHLGGFVLGAAFGHVLVRPGKDGDDDNGPAP